MAAHVFPRRAASTSSTVTVTGSSALAVLAGSMGSNTWSTLATNGMTYELVFIGGDYVYSYCSKSGWDPVHRRLVLAAQGHGSGHASRLIVWDDATNTWTNTETPPIPDGDGDNPSHAFYMNTVNPANGEHFFHRYYSHAVRRRSPWNGSWTNTADDNLPYLNYSVGIEWNPALNGGVGGLACQNAWGLSTWHPTNDAWTLVGSGVPNGGSLVMGEGSGAAVYNPVDQSTLHIGGAGAYTSCVRCTSAGVTSQRANVPINVGVPDDYTPTLAIAVPGWDASGSIPQQPPILVGPGSGNVYQYVTASDSWTSRSTRPFTPAYAMWFGCPVSSYGVYVFQVMHDTFVHVYKP